MSEGTVKFHVRQIMRKFGVTNRTQVAVVCRAGGEVAPAPDRQDEAKGSRQVLSIRPVKAVLSIFSTGLLQPFGDTFDLLVTCATFAW
jgi:hypothetical protein